MNDQPRRLERSTQNRILLGVCGGLAEYFELDPTIVRIVFLIAAFIWGVSIPLYLLLALIMPRAGRSDTPPRNIVRENFGEMRDDAERLGRQAEHEIRRATGRDQPTDGGSA